MKVYENLSELEQELDDECIKKVLLQRMDALALPTLTEDKEHETRKLVVFRLRQQKYAFSASFVAEVLPVSVITEVPCTPDYVTGVINLRGKIISVLDISKVFQLAHLGVNDLGSLLVLDNGQMRFGILAEEVIGHMTAQTAEIKVMQPSINGRLSEYSSGVLGDITVLNAQKLLADQSLIVEDYS